MTREEVLEALQDLVDPHYGKSIVELGGIKDVVIKGQTVALTCVLSKDEGVNKDKLKQDITEVLTRKEIEQVHIRFRVMTDFERAQLGQEAGTPSAGSKPVSLLSPSSKVQFIAVASGKGGVGKSTVTVNLAASLSRLGKKVGIMDADIYGFSVPDMMGIEEQPRLENDHIIPVERHGVKVISMGFFVQDNAPVIWRGPMLGKMLRNFFNEVNWGDLDYMLLDLPPGTGDVALDVHQLLPGCKEIIVTTPHATAAYVAARAGAMALHTDHEIIGVVENMSYYSCSKCGNKDYIFGRGGGGKLAEELHTELLAQIPLGAPDNHVAEPDYSPSVFKESTETGQLYLELARKVLEKL
ncbi:Mrp/NBP35 family ATP-binding protein [Paenibacillus larvae]|uniref:Iron-sulfur cluster carrier protein n=3 Tax=Paenibacillus larvae TaxID=1464 RepID=V9WBD4_9BACL|nr:Mrp/NBP35 family ATP-binding protein [Paenibacillus larvae]AHD07503.1 ATP-binding Mrp protein [Paenibacillus larvae subsp. larvae DSM 25430]ARF68148.1 MRP family ATP-binding protein [Paenibacillus larvae subsp. pulvifaciens]AVG14065.1 ATP-binding Mrp protein [Paenibacillus larvae subsp. larvae DSM 25430]MDR5567994.1 Mrp/NBP35 family ATP-binding protein [Paenibacillus larvae]MDR5594001.1 Mrp/NBP35 family ATP-binding protein [Paenibacillus larvae]